MNIKRHCIFWLLIVAKVSTINSQYNLSGNDTNFFKILEKIKENKKQDLNNNEDRNENNDSKWEWFWINRIDKNGSLNQYGIEMRKVVGDNQKKKTNTTSVMRLSDTPASSMNWIPYGPSSIPLKCHYFQNNPIYDNNPFAGSNGIGQVKCIWANSTNNVYIGTEGGGCWRWNGSSWVNLTDNYYAFTVKSIAVDNNTNPTKFYIATGAFTTSGSLVDNGGYGFGVYYSNNNGNS